MNQSMKEEISSPNSAKKIWKFWKTKIICKKNIIKLFYLLHFFYSHYTGSFKLRRFFLALGWGRNLVWFWWVLAGMCGKQVGVKSFGVGFAS